MSQAVATTMTEAAARTLTDEVKADAAALWTKLLRLYEGEAHTALGYSSWGTYYEAEFGQSGAYGYRLLDSARVIDALPNGHSPIGESVARELAPVLREDPDQVEEVWAEIVTEHGPTPTAAQVREVVEERKDLPAGARAVAAQVRAVAHLVKHARFITEAEHLLDLDAIHAVSSEEKDEWQSQLRAARTVLSRVIGAL